MTAPPPTRTCTLTAGVRVETGAMADWHALAPLHYRSHHAGAVTDVFRMVYAPSPDPERTGGQAASGTRGATLIGVIVYARPALSLAARDRATGGRYRSAGLGSELS